MSTFETGFVTLKTPYSLMHFMNKRSSMVTFLAILNWKLGSEWWRKPFVFYKIWHWIEIKSRNSVYYFFWKPFFKPFFWVISKHLHLKHRFWYKMDRKSISWSWFYRYNGTQFISFPFHLANKSRKYGRNCLLLHFLYILLKCRLLNKVILHLLPYV